MPCLPCTYFASSSGSSFDMIRASSSPEIKYLKRGGRFDAGCVALTTRFNARAHSHATRPLYEKRELHFADRDI